ncbi:hypothetical protein D9757_000106 [Collybiopsis confluens]|uniref:Uncharacterized protein n=1 Tax=Collybiopsis confluens TaxID=2823264 RepID=A0A8H5I2F9_9AGAR|nr:hypothetical protein D9757_000106 [Collybiopsis confluens]
MMVYHSPFNHESLIDALGRRLDVDGSQHPSQSARKRKRLDSDPILPDRLPNSSFIQREADSLAPQTYLRQLWRTPLSPTSDSDSDTDSESDDTRSHARRRSSYSTESTSPSASPSRIQSAQKALPNNWKEPQPFEVFRAVERKDIPYLMEIRDRAFHLLVDKNGDTTPLVHALRIGSHRDVAIVLIGAFSRYINNLDDSDLQKPRTKTILKNIRYNLKIAIDYDLAISKGDLIASLMQIYVMSEGDKWIHAQTSGNVKLALRAGTTGQPVKTAETAVRKFATKELGKAELIASLEDYISNATADLILMAAWSQALESINAEPIPVSYFARDDRVYKAFVERVQRNENAIARSLSRRLKWQIRVLRSSLEGRSITYRVILHPQMSAFATNNLSRERSKYWLKSLIKEPEYKHLHSACKWCPAG